jgi:hypothetical protein
MTSDRQPGAGARKVRCSAPGRAGIVGNPTDMYGGAVISCSVPLRAWVEIVPAERLSLESGGERAVIRGLDDLRPRNDRFDLARAVFRYFRLPDMAGHITFGSDIPMQPALGPVQPALGPVQGERAGRFDRAAGRDDACCSGLVGSPPASLPGG